MPRFTILGKIDVLEMDLSLIFEKLSQNLKIFFLKIMISIIEAVFEPFNTNKKTFRSFLAIENLKNLLKIVVKTGHSGQTGHAGRGTSVGK